MDLEYRSGVVFPSNLNLLLSEYIKFWLFALFTEFLNNLIITCFQQGKKNLLWPKVLILFRQKCVPVLMAEHTLKQLC